MEEGREYRRKEEVNETSSDLTPSNQVPSSEMLTGCKSNNQGWKQPVKGPYSDCQEAIPLPSSFPPFLLALLPYLPLTSLPLSCPAPSTFELQLHSVMIWS